MASAAVDTCSFFLNQSLRLGECQNCVVVLYDWQFIREDRTAHHRTTHQDLSRFLLVAAAEFDYVMNLSTDWSDYVGWTCNSITVNGHSLSDQRHTVSEVLTYECNSSNVGQDDAQVSRQYTRVHGLTCYFVYQNSFCTLWISCLQLESPNVGDSLRCQQLIQVLDCIHFVVFDTDETFGQTQELHNQLAAGNQVFCIFQHQSVVRSDEWFTFCSVDD